MSENEAPKKPTGFNTNPDVVIEGIQQKRLGLILDEYAKEDPTNHIKLLKDTVDTALKQKQIVVEEQGVANDKELIKSLLLAVSDTPDIIVPIPKESNSDSGGKRLGQEDIKRLNLDYELPKEIIENADDELDPDSFL